MAKTEITTIIRPTDTNLAERIRQDLERDVRHAVHARRATLRLLELRIQGLMRKLPSSTGGSMAYGGITGFLKVGGGRDLVSNVLDKLSVEWANKSTDELRAILAPELQKIADMIDKAERVDELERQVANLEYLLSEKAEWYRQKFVAAKQRSKDNAPC